VDAGDSKNDAGPCSQTGWAAASPATGRGDRDLLRRKVLMRRIANGDQFAMANAFFRAPNSRGDLSLALSRLGARRGRSPKETLERCVPRTSGARPLPLRGAPRFRLGSWLSPATRPLSRAARPPKPTLSSTANFASSLRGSPRTTPGACPTEERSRNNCCCPRPWRGLSPEHSEVIDLAYYPRQVDQGDRRDRRPSTKRTREVARAFYARAGKLAQLVASASAVSNVPQFWHAEGSRDLI